MDTSEIVDKVLRNAAEEEKKYKSIEVQRDVEVEIDLGNLLACDPNALDLKKYRVNKGDYLSSIARDATQLLFNQLWKLPVHRVEDAITVKLPEPTTVLPREKRVPKDRPATKWEKYAKQKGIMNKKKSTKVWSEEEEKWIPRFGYKSKNDLKKDWLLEVPANADPMEDQFSKKKKAKQERVAKNELQRLRNIARAKKRKVPGVGLTPTEKPDKTMVNKAIHLSKHSTASIGKFENKLPKEPLIKNLGKRRKFEPVMGSLKKEQDLQKNILDGLSRNRPEMNVTKAVNRQIREEQQSAAAEKREGRKGGKGKGSRKAAPKTAGRKRTKGGARGKKR
ncbi:ribosome biogenesis regulatory protein homolog [Strongylocentrotus purpuratus]|uniref:Ribosome biogenesis regulatory protein n=1 Tax=Strongylocentrotus purpuratus TaxID=7668 RepID=A0A7M7RC72_STRPU|nr:ribosome biogenesis regulatory protein homolog [Strongylocentrotus purpuratus]|eukprot:XP_781111.1 PREDICTED: ribosome biogenesis regulatory protein homolog [Strongylocentrotus purpuratus]